MFAAGQNLPDDPAALKAMIASLQSQNVALQETNAGLQAQTVSIQAEQTMLSARLRAYDLLVQSLRLSIARLRKKAFGRSSEKIEREIEQLELALDDVLVEVAQCFADEVGATDNTADAPAATTADDKPPRRRPRVSAGTPRERKELDPGEACPDCGGELRLVGTDVSEVIEMIAAQLKVIEIARPKKSCRCCEKMVQVPAPSRPIPGSMAGGSLLAYILVSKYDDHLPLYRQQEILARIGVDIPRSTLADWCGRSMKILAPIIDRIEAAVMASSLIHADDTPIQVQDHTLRKKGLGKGSRKGRIWTYVCDQRPWAGTTPPAVVYRYAPNWRQEHVREHLKEAGCILQADAYKGYEQLYKAKAGEKPRFREAGCWAHWRRDFHDIWKSNRSAIARQALEYIGELYDIERKIAGKPVSVRLAERQKRSKSRLDKFKAWADEQLKTLPPKSSLAAAFRYGLTRWPAFTLFIEDGRVAIDNNPAERALRPIGIGRRNWLFAGSDAGAVTLARAMTLIETAKMHGLDPQRYLTDVLRRIHDHKVNKLDELLPWNWVPMEETVREAA